MVEGFGCNRADCEWCPDRRTIEQIAAHHIERVTKAIDRVIADTKQDKKT